MCKNLYLPLVGMGLKVEILGHMAMMYLTFWRIAKLYFKVAAPIGTPQL